MIYVDLSSFVPNDDWRYLAWQLTQELLMKPVSERQNFIDTANRENGRNGVSFWGQLKRLMPFPNKCWYSEQIVLRICQ